MFSTSELEKLKSYTQRYWNNYSFPKAVEEEYILNLLPREWECVKNNITPLPWPCERLVLLVGFSMEPLLQSICAYRPLKVLFVLNDMYGDYEGIAFGKEVTELIQRLPKSTILDAPPEVEEPHCLLPAEEKGEYPSRVFQLLVEQLIRPKTPLNRTIIDITGGKKSMIAGAFFFAAYARVPISYVDFDAYEPSRGRPYGFSGKIQLLRNPYETFRLQEWEEVKRHYGKYAFRAAQQVLFHVRGAMDTSGFFTPGQMKAVEHLDAILEIYALWDNGDFQGAQQRSKELSVQAQPFFLPKAVKELGEEGYWPHAASQDDSTGAAKDLLDGLKRLESGGDGVDSLYFRSQHLILYARDEVAKIDRLIAHNEDDRSALLRAAGLNEVLLKARLMALWKANQLKVVAVDGESRDRSASEFPKMEQALLDSFLIRDIQGVVEGSSTKLRKDRYTRLRSDITLKRTEGGPKLPFFLTRSSNQNDVLPLQDLLDLRNKATHTFLSVSRSIARDALAMVKANLEDFQAHWAGLIPGFEDSLSPGEDSGVESLVWEALCEVCGIDFLPPMGEDSTREEVSP